MWLTPGCQLVSFDTTHKGFFARGLRPLVPYHVPKPSYLHALRGNLPLTSSLSLSTASDRSSDGCRLLAATVRDISVISASAGMRRKLACDHGAPGSMHLAYYSRFGYGTMPGGLASSWLQTHIVGHDSPFVLRLWLVASGYVLYDVSACSSLHLSVDNANTHVNFLRRQ